MEAASISGMERRQIVFIKHMRNLYSKIKIFHFKEKIDSLPRAIAEILPPIHIRIKPTNVCNHNCWYCAYRAENLQLGQDMVARDYIPRAKMMEIINDMSEMGVKSITFSGGGEPLCYPYLIEAIKKLSQTSVKFAALTNGAKLQGELAEIFAYYGSWLRISMDGWDDESYSAYRGTRDGEFTRIMDNIRNFKRCKGKCYLGVSIIVDKKNALHIYELIEKLKDCGVNSIKASPCFVSNDVNENYAYHKPIFDGVKEQIMRSQSRFSKDGFEVFDGYHSQMENFTKEYTWCPYLQVLPVIGADLNIYSCQDKAYNLKQGLIGSVRNQSFKTFWFSGKEKFFIINPSQDCQHHCIAHEKNKMVLEYLDSNGEHLEFV